MDQKHLLDKWVHDGKKHFPYEKQPRKSYHIQDFVRLLQF